VNEHDEGNGHHPDDGGVKVDDPKPQHEAKPVPAPTVPTKESIARDAQIMRAGWVAEIDQLEAEKAAAHKAHDEQVAGIEASIKQARAEIRNIDKIHGNAIKVVQPAGAPKAADTPKKKAKP
jgi:hypothetical protein